MLVYCWDLKEGRPRVKKARAGTKVKYIGYNVTLKDNLAVVGESHQVLAKDAEVILHYWKHNEPQYCASFDISDKPWV